MHRHLEVEGTPENALSEISAGICLVDRLLNPSGWFRILAADVDERMVNLVGDGGDDDPFDHLVGIALEELAILEGPGLRLIAVDDQVGGSGGRQKAPLQAGRESGAAPPQKTRALDHFDQFVPGHRRRSPRLGIAVGRLVAVDRVAVGGMVGHPPGDDEGIGGHVRSPKALGRGAQWLEGRVRARSPGCFLDRPVEGLLAAEKPLHLIGFDHRRRGRSKPADQFPSFFAE